MQSVGNEQLEMIFFLGELERQADMFGRSFDNAMSAVTLDDPIDVWRHLQSALFAGIVVNRLLTGRGARSAERAVERAGKLRRLVALDGADESPILTLHEIRNHLEHVDERIDSYLAQFGTASLSDFYLSDGHYLVSNADATQPLFAGLRAFNPERGLLHFDRSPLNMFLLDLDMLVLLNNAREAQLELCRDVHGRQAFAATWWRLDTVSVPSVKTRWLAKRAALKRTIQQPVDLPPSVRLWVQPPD